MRYKLSYPLAGFAMVLAASLTATGVNAQDSNSGFLRDYSKLQETTDTAGKTVRAWASPAFTPENYRAVILDPIVFYPEPQPSDVASAEVLKQILGYSNDALRRALAQRFDLVDRPGPGVARLRLAITSVAAEREGLKPYQYIPIAFLATMARRAASGTPHKALVVFEVEASDSKSGDLLAARTRVASGERLSTAGDKQFIALDTVKPLIDELTDNAFPELSRFVAAK